MGASLAPAHRSLTLAVLKPAACAAGLARHLLDELQELGGDAEALFDEAAAGDEVHGRHDGALRVASAEGGDAFEGAVDGAVAGDHVGRALQGAAHVALADRLRDADALLNTVDGALGA